MRRVPVVLLVLLSGFLIPAAQASLNPNEIVVVYNNHSYWNTGLRQSKAVADYYCAARGIPDANKIGISWDRETHYIIPADFLEVFAPLRDYLASRPGFEATDPATDPVKCLVLCYGTPMSINGSERLCSVDSALTLLFNSTAWGFEPIASYGGGGTFDNPYRSTTGPDPANRTKPTDFGSFRETDTGFTVYAPNFTIVRMLDASHALAAGTKGVLYKGTMTGSAWEWTVIDDLTKQFITHDVKDICTLDPAQYPDAQYRGYAWVCTSGSGSIIKTTDYGASWTTVLNGTINAQYNDSTLGISFYNTSNGWRAGSYYDTTVYPPVFHYFVRRGANLQTDAGTLPTNYAPASIAAISDTEAYVSGSGGIYRITNSGSTWTQQYAGSTGDIWVKEIGGVKKGWAVTTNGKILRTTDGTTWNELTSPTFSGTADLAVYDDSHVAIAYGSGSFLVWDGNNWTTDSSDSSTNKCSVAWAGGNDVVACKSGSSIIRWQHGTGWNGTSQIPDATWKMRYTTARLDGYARTDCPGDWVTVTIDGQQKSIPKDVKVMIDRAISADAAGPSALLGEGGGRVVIDDSPDAVVARKYSDSFKNVISQIVGERTEGQQLVSNVVVQPGDEKDVPPTPNVYGVGEPSVACYTSSGSYDCDGDQYTTWWRPFNTWKDGAIGIFWNVSGDCRTLRSPSYVWKIERDLTAPVNPYELKVYGLPGTSQYNYHQVELYETGGSTPIASATFSNGTGIINLSGLTLPANTTIKLRFPSNDGGMHNNELMLSKDCGNEITNAQSTGIAYKCTYSQCLTIDLIREGCSAVTGNVMEPFAFMTPNPEVIIPQYASGRTWVESAWMGIPNIPWMQVVVGDPLMSPYAVRPTVAFASPSPTEHDLVRGSVSLVASAIPYGSGTIQKVDFWITGDQVCRRIGSDSQAPYECTWNTEEMSGGNRVYPNGIYEIQAVAYQAGGGTKAVSRSVVIDDAISAVSITSPQNDDSVVGSTTQLTAQVSPSAGTLKFWLLGNGDPIQLDGSYVPASVTDGEYELQAIVTDHNNSPFFSSYSSRRPIRVVDNFAASVGGLGSLSNGTTVYVAGTPVAAGSSPAIDYPLTQGHAFYLEDASRCAGIRVVAANPVQAGRNVSVLGVLHVGSGISERYIEAIQVWDDGAADVPAPVGMSNLWLGGKDTDDRYGQTNPGIGNVGLLARAWGTVTYADVVNKFAYIDDGSNIQDGNSLSAVGVRVYFGDLPVPTVDSYMTVTGISSVELIGGYRERMLRVAASYSDSCSGAVTYVGSDFIYVDDGTHPWDGNEITAPRIVPQDGSSIPAAAAGVLGRKVYFGSLAKPGIDDDVSITGQSYYSYANGRPAPMRVSSPSDLTYVERYIPARSTTSGIVAIDDPYTVLPAGTKIRLTDAHVQGVETGYFFVRPVGNWPVISCAVPTALVGGETVTITGEVLAGRDQNGWLRMDPGPGHIYLGGSQYGAMSVSPQEPATMSASGMSTSGRTDGREGGGPFRPWPYPTAEEILASESFRLQYGQVGAIGWALSQPDGSVIDLPAEAICGEWYDGRVLGLKEWFEPIPYGPRLLLYLDKPIQLDVRERDMATIDIIGGKLVTLSDGIRALVKPEAVYAYTDSTGRWMFPFPWPKFIGRNGITDGSENWPWKLKVAP